MGRLRVRGLLGGLVSDEEEQEESSDVGGDEELERTSSDVMKWTRPLTSVHLRSSLCTCDSDEANFFS